MFLKKKKIILDIALVFFLNTFYKSHEWSLHAKKLYVSNTKSCKNTVK